jgi:predicted kinase
MEAIIFVGIQAVGKSYFYREYFFNTHIRLNLDMLKTRHREHLLLQACIMAKQPFVVDNTNVSVAERAKYIAMAKSARFSVIGYYFRANVAEALQRNNQRTGRDVVPVKGILGTYKKLKTPCLQEGFDRLYSVDIDAANKFIVKEGADEG